MPVSARLATVPEPRATLVALHGGWTSSAYFDCPGHPELSLLRHGAAAGFTVLAIDRPGFGSSAPHIDRLRDPVRRAEVTLAAIEAHLDALPRGVGTFLAAHSAGCYLAIQMAAGAHGADLLGLELGGFGFDPTPEATERFGATGIAELLWQPAGHYPPDIVGGSALGAVDPRYDADLGARWRDITFPELAAEIRVPIRLTLGKQEAIWAHEVDDLERLASRFTAATRTVVNIQPHSGHNLSVGKSAAAYHFALLSFVEECALAREMGEIDCYETQVDGGPGRPRG
ncbi:alpha/beta hydrolase [Nocardia sp. NEAU-351]|uniref:Alpha/beta hydrolase n=1 Tax=Nocardia bovistercoris TaxID=2785916 RepID=A0A931N7C2_9NOCA|nr:alpha/beta hydrolase [Nocardia bovistercoris]